MTENEQVEEMAALINKPCVEILNEAGVTVRDCPLPIDCAECTARNLYKAGYRKVARGEWITPWVMKPYGKAYGTPYCSVCKQMDERKGNFCPFCGADMRGKDKDV